MMSYEEPVKNLMQETDGLSSKVRELTNQIDDMYNLTLQADERANAAERLNFENKKLVDPNSISVLKDATDQTSDHLAKAKDLNDQSKALFDEAEYNFVNLS